MATSSLKAVRAVERALDILEAFVDVNGEKGPTALASALGLNKSTVLRLLYTMERKGYVVQNPRTQRYRLGPAVLALAGHFFSENELANIAFPEVERLRDQTEETVSIYVRSGFERICIQRLEGNRSVRIFVQLGQRLPMYAGAASQVLTAFLPDEERAELIKGLPVPVGFDLRAWVSRLDKVRREGYAISHGERQPEIAAVAAPIFGRGDRLVAALSLSGPVTRLTVEDLERLAPLVRERAAAISRLLVAWPQPGTAVRDRSDGRRSRLQSGEGE